MDKDVNSKDLVTWALMIAALYLLNKVADCGCGSGCGPTNPMSSSLQSPDWVSQLGSGVNVL